jgi:hypothetical protein
MFFLLFQSVVLASVSVNIVVANPSSTEKQTVPVRYILPSEIDKNDILDAGGLEIDYDISAGAYCVAGNVELGPSETKTYKIVINDVWKVQEADIAKLKKILDDKVNSIKEDEQKQSAKLVADTIKIRLDSILEFQKENAGDVEKRMGMYSQNTARFKDIENTIFSLTETKNLKDEKKEGKSTVTLVIEANNTTDQSVNTPIKYYLPKEVLPEYIEEAAGFTAKHDPVLDQFYLFQELLFAPGEKRVFNVQVKNVWLIPQSVIDGYIKETSDLKEQLAKTVFVDAAEMLFSSIKANIDIIIDTQKSAVTVKDYISTYRGNKKREKNIQDDIEKLRKLLEASKEKVESKGGIKNFIQTVQVLRIFKELSAQIFKKKMSPGFIWKLILGIVAFVLALTAFFYGIWTMKLKKEEKRKYDKIE